MKTSQSFFPTRTHLKSREVRRERTYQLIKKQEELPEPEEQELNIFREAHRPRPPELVERPVGGTDLFRKMEQAGRDRNDNRRHSKRSNKEPTQRNISSNFANNRRKERPEDDRENQREQDPLFNKPISEISHPLRASLPEETFKAHAAYLPSPTANSRSRQTTCKPSGHSESLFRPVSSNAGHSTALRPATSKPMSQKWTAAREEWASEQRREYQDKAALLNEISYNRPLVEVYGDRYFEYLLRNRFEEDLRPHPYIYQIAHKFTHSRAIDDIKKYRPDIKEKPVMVLRGRRLAHEDE